MVKCPVHLNKCDCSVEYRLYGAIMNLPSYGLIANDSTNPMISRKDVLALLLGRERERPAQEEPGK